MSSSSETNVVNPKPTCRGHPHNRPKFGSNRKQSFSFKNRELDRSKELPALMDTIQRRSNTMMGNWEMESKLNEEYELPKIKTILRSNTKPENTIELNVNGEYDKMKKIVDRYLQENYKIDLPGSVGYLDRTKKWVEEARKEMLKRSMKPMAEDNFFSKDERQVPDYLHPYSDEKVFYFPSPTPPLFKIDPFSDQPGPSSKALDTSEPSWFQEKMRIEKKRVEKKKTAGEVKQNIKSVGIKKNKENMNSFVNMMNPTKYLEEMFDSPPHPKSSYPVKVYIDKPIAVDKSSLPKLKDCGARRMLDLRVDSLDKILFDDYAEDAARKKMIKGGAQDNLPDFDNFVINPIKTAEMKFYPRRLF